MFGAPLTKGRNSRPSAPGGTVAASFRRSTAGTPPIWPCGTDADASHSRLAAEVGATSMASIVVGSGINALIVISGAGVRAGTTTPLMAHVPTMIVTSPRSRPPAPSVAATQSMQPAITGSPSGSPVRAAAWALSPATTSLDCRSGGNRSRSVAGSPTSSSAVAL